MGSRGAVPHLAFRGRSNNLEACCAWRPDQQLVSSGVDRLYAEGADPRAERAIVGGLGRLFTEKRMELARAAPCVEVVAALRGPVPERAARTWRNAIPPGTQRK